MDKQEECQSKPGNEERRKVIKMISAGLGLLVGYSVFPADARTTGRSADPNAEHDFTTIEITIENNMGENMDEGYRDLDLSFKYYIAAQSASSGKHYELQESRSTEQVTKLSICKAMGFSIRDNMKYTGTLTSWMTSTNTRLNEFELKTGRWFRIATKRVLRPPVYAVIQKFGPV